MKRLALIGQPFKKRADTRGRGWGGRSFVPTAHGDYVHGSSQLCTWWGGRRRNWRGSAEERRFSARGIVLSLVFFDFAVHVSYLQKCQMMHVAGHSQFACVMYRLNTLHGFPVNILVKGQDSAIL